MIPPAVTDPIVAVSSAWRPSTLGIVRLSGPGSTALARRLGCVGRSGEATPCWTREELDVGDGLRAPATALWFAAPRSYTGQDLVELHTIGCLPLLRELVRRLIEAGARRALPGEFTARAFLHGKLDAGEVDAVQALIRAADAAAARRAARLERLSAVAVHEALKGRVLDLLARVEAGIDFAEEEDVRFVSADEAVAELNALLGEVARLEEAAVAGATRELPHAALVGLPNAGKSTLFNALLGRERAIVSPIVGTTRDVLAAQTRVGDADLVLQDCAGLGGAANDLERSAHLRAEATARQADLVVWVHDVRQPWAVAELEALRSLDAPPPILVLSKIDRLRGAPDVAFGEPAPSADDPLARGAGIDFQAVVRLSAATGAGLDVLRSALARAAARMELEPGWGEVSWERVRARLRQARERVSSAELLALELREAVEELSPSAVEHSDERVLDRIFTNFCIGK